MRNEKKNRNNARSIFFNANFKRNTHTYIYIYNNLYNLRLRNSLKCEKIIGIDIFEIFEKILLRRFELKLKNLLEQRVYIHSCVWRKGDDTFHRCYSI